MLRTLLKINREPRVHEHDTSTMADPAWDFTACVTRWAWNLTRRFQRPRIHVNRALTTLITVNPLALVTVCYFRAVAIPTRNQLRTATIFALTCLPIQRFKLE